MNTMKETLVLAASIIIAGVAIGGGIYLSRSGGGTQVAGTNSIKSQNIEIGGIQPDDRILGPRDAKIVLIEFSDTECPFCKQFHKTMQQIMADAELKGKIAWIYRHYPIESIHKKAKYEAQALECAAIIGGNEKFWALADKVFEVTPSNDKLDISLLPQYAAEVGLSEAEFRKCLNSDQAIPKVERDIADGVAAGVRGTPFSVIIGPKGKKYPINGAVPFETLKAQIKSAL